MSDGLDGMVEARDIAGEWHVVEFGEICKWSLTSRKEQRLRVL
jgi:hypothetical protein